MTGKGLIIGIDYTDRYCQACYYSRRHQRPESVSAGTDVMRYLIPSVLCYDPGRDEWMIGNSAVRISENPGVYTFTELLRNQRAGTTAVINEKSYSYVQLMAIYFGKLLEFIQIRTSVMSVENINVTMKEVDRETRETMEEVFDLLDVPRSRVKLLSAAESFGYYIINERLTLWKGGALLFDFNSEGFYAKQLSVNVKRGRTLVFINEYDFSADFSMDNLASETYSDQMDRRLANLYQDFSEHVGDSSVYFTGEGFSEQWFGTTLNSISGEKRAFKGNNIYVKGACLAGYLRSEGLRSEYTIICRGRTRADISLEAWDKGERADIILSPAAFNWFDAGYHGDFILENENSIVLQVTSIISGAKTDINIDLTDFPERPDKTTRVGVDIRYTSEYQCEITVTDKGFGEFYPSEGKSVTQYIDLEEYI